MVIEDKDDAKACESVGFSYPELFSKCKKFDFNFISILQS